MRSSVIAVLLAGALAPGLLAGPVGAGATFSGGLYGSWTFSFTSGAPDIYLQEIRIDLSSVGLSFDTAAGGFGSLDFRDIAGFGGTDVSTGLTGVLPGTGSSLDGDQVLIFQFSDFTAGESFTFTGDVDGPNPALTPLRDCSSLRPIPRALCVAANGVTQAANDARLLAAANVMPGDFSGAQVTYTFGGPGYYTARSTQTFGPTGGLSLASEVTLADEVLPTPEPGSFALLGLGLLFGGAFLRRRCR